MDVKRILEVCHNYFSPREYARSGGIGKVVCAAGIFLSYVTLAIPIIFKIVEVGCRKFRATHPLPKEMEEAQEKVKRAQKDFLPTSEQTEKVKKMIEQRENQKRIIGESRIENLIHFLKNEPLAGSGNLENSFSFQREFLELSLEDQKKFFLKAVKEKVLEKAMEQIPKHVERLAFALPEKSKHHCDSFREIRENSATALVFLESLKQFKNLKYIHLDLMSLGEISNRPETLMLEKIGKNELTTEEEDIRKTDQSFLVGGIDQGNHLSYDGYHATATISTSIIELRALIRNASRKGTHLRYRIELEGITVAQEMGALTIHGDHSMLLYQKLQIWPAI